MVAGLVVVVVLVLFNLPQLQNLQPRGTAGAGSGSPTGTSPQPARQVAGSGP